MPCVHIFSKYFCTFLTHAELSKFVVPAVVYIESLDDYLYLNLVYQSGGNSAPSHDSYSDDDDVNVSQASDCKNRIDHTVGDRPFQEPHSIMINLPLLPVVLGGTEGSGGHFWAVFWGGARHYQRL